MEGVTANALRDTFHIVSAAEKASAGSADEPRLIAAQELAPALCMHLREIRSGIPKETGD